MVHAIDERGREIIEMNTNIPRLLEIAQIISKIEIGVTMRRVYAFREQVIIEWLLDLTRSRLRTDTLIIREVIAAELPSPPTLMTSPTKYLIHVGSTGCFYIMSDSGINRASASKRHTHLSLCYPTRNRFGISQWRVAFLVA